jgi:hypothetical protein
MLRNISELFNYRLLATDGEIGKCKDFLFDDAHWGIRYMVADTRKWFVGRKVLVSPLSLGTPRWDLRKIPVLMSTEKIKNCPPLDESAPVSRQYEMLWSDYYGYPYYWAHESMWGIDQYLIAKQKARHENIEDPTESHLRSAKEVKGYHIKALDSEIGHVEDFIVDDSLWLIRYLIIDTRNWLPGRKVLISPAWIDTVDWSRQAVSVKHKKETIKNSPEYNPEEPINLGYELRLYDYYGRSLN